MTRIEPLWSPETMVIVSSVDTVHAGRDGPESEWTVVDGGRLRSWDVTQSQCWLSRSSRPQWILPLLVLLSLYVAIRGLRYEALALHARSGRIDRPACRTQ